MSEINYKLVCYGDFQIPVPDNFKWLAWDEDGSPWVSITKPHTIFWSWDSDSIRIFSSADIPPPEPDLPWDKQLYYIG